MTLLPGAFVAMNSELLLGVVITGLLFRQAAAPQADSQPTVLPPTHIFIASSTVFATRVALAAPNRLCTDNVRVAVMAAPSLCLIGFYAGLAIMITVERHLAEVWWLWILLLNNLGAVICVLSLSQADLRGPSQKQTKSVEILERITRRTFVAEHAAMPARDCVVCLEQLLSNERLCELKCGHLFHHTCISQWIYRASQPGCPLRCSGTAEP